jgi:WhiB family redox-sensing transcriptional regulator
MVVAHVPGQLAAAEDQRGAGKERLEWWRWAACQETDPELFFPVAAQGPARDEIARAKAVCGGCRVRRQCLQFALATRQMHGVWGGTTADERLPHVRREHELRERAGTVRVTTVY